MTKLLKALVILTLISTSCNQTPHHSTKEEGIEKFKTEMKILLDSSNYYYDFTLDKLKNEEKPESISLDIKNKINGLERQIDTKSRSFQLIAEELDLTSNEYEQVFSELKKIMEPIIEKHKELSEKGVSLK